MEEDIAYLKREIFWLGISCVCAGIGLILCSYLFSQMERRMSILAMNSGTDRRNIETLFAIQARKEEKPVESPVLISEPLPESTT